VPQVLQFGVAEKIAVRNAPRRRHAGQASAVGRCRGGGRILLRSAPERVLSVHRSLRSGPVGGGQTACQLRRVAAGPGGQGPGLPPRQLGAGHADGGRLSGNDRCVIAVRHGRRQRTVDQAGRLLQGRSDNIRVTASLPSRSCRSGGAAAGALRPVKFSARRRWCGRKPQRPDRGRHNNIIPTRLKGSIFVHHRRLIPEYRTVKSCRRVRRELQ